MRYRYEREGKEEAKQLTEELDREAEALMYDPPHFVLEFRGGEINCMELHNLSSDLKQVKEGLRSLLDKLESATENVEYESVRYE